MKKIEVIASDRGLDCVTVTSGRNGYPSGLRKAVVFDTQEEAASFAREIGGEVVLLHRRDGWGLWESRGRELLPREFSLADRAYNDDYEPCAFALRYERDYEQALDEMNALLADAQWDLDEDEREQYEPDQSVINTLANYDGRALVVVLFVCGQQTIDYVFEDGATRWHDSDVNEYAIAVVCDDEWDDHFRSLMEQKKIYENENLAHAVAFTAALLAYDAPAEFKFGGYDLEITRVRDAIYDPRKSCNVQSDVCVAEDLSGNIPVEDMQEFTGYVLDVMEDFGLLNLESGEK